MGKYQLDDLIKNEKTLEEFINELSDFEYVKKHDEETKKDKFRKNKSKEFNMQKNMKKVCDEVNEKTLKNYNKDKKILIDSPMMVEKSKEDKVDIKTLNVENAVDAKNLKKKEKVSVKEISEKILTDIFETIIEISNDEYSESKLFIDVCDDYSDYVNKLEIEDLEKVIDNIYYFLTDKNYDVNAELTIDEDDEVNVFVDIIW